MWSEKTSICHTQNLSIQYVVMFKYFGQDHKVEVPHANRSHTRQISCSPCQSSVGYGNTKITQHAQTEKLCTATLLRCGEQRNIKVVDHKCEHWLESPTAQGQTFTKFILAWLGL